MVQESLRACREHSALLVLLCRSTMVWVSRACALRLLPFGFLAESEFQCLPSLAVNGFEAPRSPVGPEAVERTQQSHSVSRSFPFVFFLLVGRDCSVL